jgi:hypothetical protein
LSYDVRHAPSIAAITSQVLLTLMPSPWDLRGMLLLVARWHELGCGGDMVQVGCDEQSHVAPSVAAALST